ncbi:hypothetical protein HYH02_013284 [Chlamydomonas schloesseri]|uniref:PAS domain-containing protein n=1 Tax=Chlamydomonas schloesseri TaxID=2026947 RepID=A0A835W0E8_9CHLO|nr:hypothetical protein HYH02_013284 [Chlamydomonas schloesseri]|eukprot:KAG2431591.1 hypothetical protein HYH02_013284 [Chlamydomonas schloesseri]
MSHWKWSVLRTTLEFLMNFLVAFNTTFSLWRIDVTEPVWQFVRWTLWRVPIVRLYGYDMYIRVLYVMVSLIWISVVGLVWLTFAMRKAEQSKWLRGAAMLLHVVYDVIYVMCYVTFFDYLIYTADCDFGKTGMHMWFTHVSCVSMPHLVHMMVALVTGVIFLAVTCLFVIASCDLNPAAHGVMASPAAYTRLRILAAKAVYIAVAADLDAYPRIQSGGMLVAVALVWWWNTRKTPFYRQTVNIIWSGLWAGVLLPCVLLCVNAFTKHPSEAFLKKNTMTVLYALFPVIAGGMGIAAVHIWAVMRPAAKFKDLPPSVKLQKVHKFESMDEVERLARVMRHYDIDGDVLPEAAAFGETIIKAGQLYYPNSPFLLLLYANFVLEVKKDGPAARTQLQLAGKQNPNVVERYQIFCTNETSKRLKDSQDGGMDLQAYIEFKRNFRAVLRVHKDALLTQAELWSMMLRTSVKVSQIDSAMEALEASVNRAHQVYKRVLERYPGNGKLLRCYGKFLETVRHDHIAAGRVYGEANRQGGADALLTLDINSGLASGKPDFLTSMSMEDDAVIVVDAEGTIMMVSQAVQKTFGYAKIELEGTNVATLMPQPFSQRHPGYMQRYVGGGEPHMLDSVREVVALHKERFVFPVQLCVTKLSGSGPDSIFLGVVRPVPPNPHVMRAWLSPNGTFLCADQQFASAVGRSEGELVGHPLLALAASAEAVERLLERSKAATAAELEGGEVVVQGLELVHRYLPEPLALEVVVGLAGTDGQRILVLNCKRLDGVEAGVLVTDTHMRLKFASLEVALLLGYTMRQLAGGMKLDALLPPPFNTLHQRWVKDVPHEVKPGSCRSGVVVHFLAETGAQVPVRLAIHTKDVDVPGAPPVTMHVVKVTKVTPEEVLAEKRITLTIDFAGRVLDASPPDSTLFNFPARELLGSGVWDFCDMFTEWCERSGDSQVQLMLLALLLKEQEMPGTSLRVKIIKPKTKEEQQAELPPLPGQARARKPPPAVMACLQVELEEDGESGGSGDDDTSGMRVRLTLWRRDVLSGVVELDESLTLRRASPLLGLITGVPSSVMIRKPLSKFLNFPPEVTTWEQLVVATGAGNVHGHHRNQKSSLKSAVDKGVVSPILALVGAHPDSGTMRLLVQGVTMLGPGGRPKITLTVHPDTTFTGAHVDFMKLLKLDSAADGSMAGGPESVKPARSVAGDNEDAQSYAVARRAAGGSRSRRVLAASRSARASGEAGGPGQRDDGAEEGAAAEEKAKPETADGDKGAGGSGEDVDDEGHESGSAKSSSAVEEDEDGEGGDVPKPDGTDAAILHREATNKSEFVAQWVRTLSKQVSGKSLLPDLAGSAPRRLESPRATSSLLATIPEGPAEAAGEADDAAKRRAPSRGTSRRMDAGADKAVTAAAGASSPPDGKGKGRKVGPADDDASSAGDDEGEGKKGNKDDRSENGSEVESSASGSQAASGISGLTDQSAATTEVMVDARRGRLLKAMNRLLLGPALTYHIDRLRTHSYGIISVMFLMHIISYVLITYLIRVEHTNIYMVQNQANAMDRSQLVATRVMIGTFCARANVTPVSICADSMNRTVTRMVANLLLMEEYHQAVYLGTSDAKTVKQSPEVYDIWTQPKLVYQVYLDTHPPSVQNTTAGAWQLGNRYIAAAREAMYMMPSFKDNYRFHRNYAFVINNGLGPLFEGYARALDLLVSAAWDSILHLRTELLILLIVEALLVQLSCSGYQMYLVQRLERARLLGMLAMLGLPGPVLRQLATTDIKIIDGSDDEDEDDLSDAGGDEDEAKKAAGVVHGSASAADGRRSSATGVEGPDAVSAATVAAVAAAATGANGGEPNVAAKRAIRRVTTPPEEDDPKAARQRSRQLLLDSGEADAAMREADAAAGAAAQAVDGQEAVVGKDGHHNTGSFKAGGGVSKPMQLNGSKKAREASHHRGHHSKHNPLRINGKTLQPSYLSVLKFMAPMFLWNLAVVIVYAISITKLQGMQEPLASLNLAGHIIYRYTRIRAIAFAFVSQDDSAGKALWRPVLSHELDLFESEYDALMYGGLPTSLIGSRFQHPAPAGTFASTAFALKFFRTKGCLRYNTTACFPPGHQYYDVTHNGLDTLVRRMMSEMRLLTQDADVDVVYNGTRYTFMAAVAGSDLYEGLQQGAQLFVDWSISRYNQVANLQTILLLVSIGLVCGYFIMVLWPHTRKLQRDATRQAALLSLVPPELDRLLCLAAASGDFVSLKTALAHHGGALTPEVLQAAAAGGSVKCCSLLLCEGCSVCLDAFRAAGRAGAVPVLQLLLLQRAGGRQPSQQQNAVEAAARGAAAGGQVLALAWLQRTCGYRVKWEDAKEAAEAGQVQLLELLLPLLPEHMQHYMDASPHEERSRLLGAIASGCPVEVLRRHYHPHMLCHGPEWCAAQAAKWAASNAAAAATAAAGRQPVATNHGQVPAYFAAASPAAAAAAAAMADHIALQEVAAMVAKYEEQAGDDDPTACWVEKLAFLRAVWPRPLLSAAMFADYTDGESVLVVLSARPDYLQRLTYLHSQSGVRPARNCAQCAALGGHVDALAYAWDVCGVGTELQVHARGYRSPWDDALYCDPLGYKHTAVLRMMHRRGVSLAVRAGDLLEVAAAAVERGDWGAAEWLLDEVLAKGAQQPGEEEGTDTAAAAAAAAESRARWSRVFAAAAEAGAGLAVLQGLHERGAAVDLAAVAMGGGEEALEWAAEQLEKEEGKDALLQAVFPATARAILVDAGNAAALAWLAARRLLPPAADWLPSLTDMCASLRAHNFWRLQLWARVQQQLQQQEEQAKHQRAQQQPHAQAQALKPEMQAQLAAAASVAAAPPLAVQGEGPGAGAAGQGGDRSPYGPWRAWHTAVPRGPSWASAAVRELAWVAASTDAQGLHGLSLAERLRAALLPERQHVDHLPHQTAWLWLCEAGLAGA